MSDRSALRQLLLQRCFLDVESFAPIPAADAAAPWFFYGCGLTLQPDGLTLAADALVEALETRFASTQIATYGMSALPLLGAMIARSRRPLTGLFVRKEPKAYGMRRLVEGAGDRARPVVFVDESMTLGASAKRGIRALEAEGYEVEGVLTLVDLSGHGSERFFPARGYVKHAVFDVYDDLGKTRDGPAVTAPPAATAWSKTRVPDGLSPADAVRFCAGATRGGAAPPRPPARFDDAYDAAGGFHVSVRSDDDGTRLAMVTAGPCDPAAFPRKVVIAGTRAIASALRAGADLERCSIALTIVGAQAPLDLRDLDHRRHVLTLQAKDGSWRRASSLPNVEFFDSAIGQIAHVKRKGRFTGEERYDALAAGVVRSVETGKRWPRYGAPPAAHDWCDDPALVASLHARARYAIARAVEGSAGGGTESGDAPPVAVIPEPVYGVGISLYAGTLIGCRIAFGDSVGECIDRATRGAWEDDRFREDRPRSADDVETVVTILHERRVLPKLSLDEAARWVLLGRHSVAAYDGDAFALILAPYGVVMEYTAAGLLAEAARKAGIPADRARWLTFETAAWLSTRDAIARLDRGFPRRDPAPPQTAASLRARLARHRAYLEAQVQPDGLPAYAHDVERGRFTLDGATGRLLFVAHALDEARRALGDPCADALGTFLAARDTGTLARTIAWDATCDATLLAALDERNDEAAVLRFAPDAIPRLTALVHDDGAIFAGRRIDGDLDFLSGAVLQALGAMDRRGIPSLDRDVLARVLAFYRRRFELVAPWGMVWWHIAGWNAWRHAVDAYPFVCELADFALARQHRASGAFLTDYTDEPAFHTACVLEGIATASELALERGDAQRAARYRDSWLEGQRFMETLTYAPGDGWFHRAVSLDGGVRATPSSANVRTDFVGHAIASLVPGLRLLDAAPADRPSAARPEEVIAAAR